MDDAEGEEDQKSPRESDFSPRQQSTSLKIESKENLLTPATDKKHVPAGFFHMADSKADQVLNAAEVAPESDIELPCSKSAAGLTPEDYGTPLQLCTECDNEVEGQLCMFCGNDQFVIVSSKDRPEKLKFHWKIVVDGFLHKLGGKNSSPSDARAWQKRYFALDEKGNFTYHRTDQLHIHQLDEELGRIPVENALITPYSLQYFPERDGYIWSIKPADSERQYLIEAEDYLDRKVWLRALVSLGAILGEQKVAKRLHSHAVMEQFMYKEGSIFKTWRRRWFTLLKDPAVVTYVKEKDTNSKLLGSIELTKETEIAEGTKTGFEILIKSTPDARRTFIIRAVDERQRQQWILALNAVVNFKKGDKNALYNANFMPAVAMSPIVTSQRLQG